MLQITEEGDRDMFAKECARILCSPYKRNIIILILGVVGAGKSYLAMELSRLISLYVSQRLGTKPEDHFNLKENCGIMLIEDIERVYEHMDTHSKNIYIIDDSSPTFGSRDFMSDENKSLNNRIVTCRPLSNCIIFTTPAKSLIDIVLRKMSGYQIFIKEPLFEIGKVVCDIRRVKIDLISDKEKIYRPQLQNFRGQKYRLHIFNRPPSTWCDEYDRRRAEAAKILAERSREVIEESMKEKEPKISKTEQYKQHYISWKDGKFGDMSLIKSCEEAGLPYQQVCNAKKKIEREGI
jgi:uridine kinase